MTTDSIPGSVFPRDTPREAGWYPRGDDETRQVWFNGQEWTTFQRVSRFPTYVERDGRLVYLDRRFLPRGQGAYERLARRYHVRMLWTLGVFFVAPVPLAAVLWASGVEPLQAVLLAPAGCMLVGLILAATCMGPGLKLFRYSREVRDRFARGDLYAPVSPPRGAKEKAKARKKGAPPGWV